MEVDELQAKHVREEIEEVEAELHATREAKRARLAAAEREPAERPLQEATRPP